jgi:toxin YoeB
MSEEADDDLEFLRKNAKSDYQKCFDLIRSILKNPKEGIGKPEPLKGSGDQARYSRRINHQDRIVYIIDEDNMVITIASCRGHYGDK